MKNIICILLCLFFILSFPACVYADSEPIPEMDIEVTKEPLPLKSGLKKDFTAYKYTITNNGENPVDIVKAQNYEISLKTYETTVYKGETPQNKKFPYVLKTLYEWPRTALLGGSLFILFAGAGCSESETPIFITPIGIFLIIVAESILLPASFIGAVGYSTYYTALTPYFYIKDMNSLRKTVEERKIESNQFPFSSINSNESEEIIVLFPKKSGDKLYLQFKSQLNNQIYEVNR